MKVFISWSGPRSALLADALREWIQDVIQSVECFASTEDIRAGQRWNNEINTWLNEADFGVLCVTQENANAPWLNFEAGALAKRIKDDTRVVPVTLGFSPAALDEPLKQFNGVRADKAGILKLVSSVAESAKATVDVNKAFERWWPDLEAKVNAIPAAEDDVEAPSLPEVPEMFTDIMAALRGLTGDLRFVSRYIERPQTGRISAEYRALAEIMSQNDSLREAVAHGDRSALMFARERAHEQMVEERHRRDVRKARGDFGKAEPTILEDGDDALDDVPSSVGTDLP